MGPVARLGLVSVSALVGLAGALAPAPAAVDGDRGRTALRIVYYEDGREPETRIARTLRCDPVGGDHPRRTAACRELARLGPATLRPVPRDAVCAQINGGPKVAFVTGTVAGRRRSRPARTRLQRDQREGVRDESLDTRARCWSASLASAGSSPPPAVGRARP